MFYWILSELPTHSGQLQQETSAISASAPAISFSTDTNMSTPENKRSKVQVNRRQKRGSESPLLAPVSTSATRRSSRFKVLDTHCVLKCYNTKPNSKYLLDTIVSKSRIPEPICITTGHNNVLSD